MMKSSSSLNKKPVGKVIGDSAAHDETVIKRQKFENEKNAEKPTIPQQRQTLREGPYWSSVDCLGEAANERAISLRELLAHIRPHASIHFNFMVDLGWVFRSQVLFLRREVGKH
jgi:hypothetical protein